MNTYDINDNGKMSIADELRELAKLKEEGILTEKESKEKKVWNVLFW